MGFQFGGNTDSFAAGAVLLCVRCAASNENRRLAPPLLAVPASASETGSSELELGELWAKGSMLVS